MAVEQWILDINQRESPPVSGVRISETGNRESGARGALAQVSLERNNALTWKVELRVRTDGEQPWVTLHTFTQADVPDLGDSAIHQFDYQLGCQYSLALDNDSTRVKVAIAG